MTNTIIFDLGKVLVNWDWEGYLDTFSYDEGTRTAIANAVFTNPDWAYGDTGLVTPDEWLSLFIENAPEYEEQIREVYEHLEETIYPYSYTLDLIQKYDELGYRIFFLSNYSEYLYEKSKDRLSFIEAFDGGIFSYREKCIKPEEKIYRLLFERYDIIPEETIFFDDNEENIRKGKELGLQAVLFTPEVALREWNVNVNTMEEGE